MTPDKKPYLISFQPDTGKITAWYRRLVGRLTGAAGYGWTKADVGRLQDRVRRMQKQREKK